MKRFTLACSWLLLAAWSSCGVVVWAQEDHECPEVQQVRTTPVSLLTPAGAIDFHVYSDTIHADMYIDETAIASFSDTAAGATSFIRAWESKEVVAWHAQVKGTMLVKAKYASSAPFSKAQSTVMGYMYSKSNTHNLNSPQSPVMKSVGTLASGTVSYSFGAQFSESGLGVGGAISTTVSAASTTVDVAPIVINEQDDVNGKKTHLKLGAEGHVKLSVNNRSPIGHPEAWGDIYNNRWDGSELKVYCLKDNSLLYYWKWK